MDNLMLRRRVLLGLLNEDYIIFADPIVEQICATNWGDGIGIKPSQAARVTDMSTQFAQNTDIVSFDEFVYFTGLTTFTSKNGSQYRGFRGCSSLVNVTLPPVTLSTFMNMFGGCSSLERVTWVSNIPVITDNINNFTNCSSLNRIDLPSIESWFDIYKGGASSASYAKGPFVVSGEGHVYVNNVEITNIVCPSTLTSIQSGLFVNFKGLQAVTIPNTVTSIGSRAFEGCSGLQSMITPSSVTSIGDRVFLGCTGLTNLVLHAYSTQVAMTSGNGTGTLYINCDVTDSQREQRFRYKYIVFNGDLTASVGNNMFVRRDNNDIPGIKAIWVEGNLIGTATNGNYGLYYTYKGSTANKCDLEFIEIMGTITSYKLFNANNVLMVQDGIIHLGYNGIACAPTSILGNGTNKSRLDKIYVGSGSSQASDEAVLALYLADTDWSVYSDKLDIWYNYNGVYKTPPTIPTE